MTEDETLKIFTNLDRPAIEARLRNLKFHAGSQGLRDLSALLESVEGKDRDELEAMLGACLGIVRPLPGAQRLVAELEMLQLNLPNLR